MEGRLRSYSCVPLSLSLSLSLCVCAAHNCMRRAVPFPSGSDGTHSNTGDVQPRVFCSELQRDLYTTQV